MARKRKKKNVVYYTRTDLIEIYGISEDVIRDLFPKPSFVKRVRRRGKRTERPYWEEKAVAAALRNDAVRAEIRKAERKKALEKRREERLTEYLLGFTPEQMFEQARELDRRFILHVGPTNSGKTHDAVLDLKQADTGTYLGPLRLLALEMFDRMNEDGCPCNLLTGEEREDIPGALITA